MDTKGKFYLGRVFDSQKAQLTGDPLLYDPSDLTTHAVVMGMTGSGKTGLCIGLLEEAALNGFPAIMIDPKGDITNTLLHFPDLLPTDFQPWVNADQARREGKTVEQAGADAAALWRKGLTDWEIGPDRLRALQNAAQFAIYTPGSDVGIPISILASLKAPQIPWEGNRELLREKISGTVTALLGLVGLDDIDPVRSREHILLSNIFETAWSQGKDLDLSELILQTQSPPFAKLGVFDVNMFFPEKDRFGLAMSLNSILAAPAFQTWIEGQPLDIPSLLYAPDGRPRHSVFYIAHLTDTERMFIVTLLFSAIEAWMRSQSGTTTLRTLIYFDEIFGYLPPVGNPASKGPMLRMLKQARAFGVGLVLATQNPVDVDYKALSNAGTWFIGKLQTERDKERLLDGLQGATGDLDRAGYDRMISGLGKRVFLLHNVHSSGAKLFQTRWAMNYLTGPLTRAQIPALNRLVGAALTPPPEMGDTQPVGVARPAAARPAAAPAVGITGVVSAAGPAVAAQPAAAPRTQPTASAARPSAAAGSSTRPSLPMGVDEYFLPNNMTLSQAFKASGRAYPAEATSKGLIYRPVVLGQARVMFLNRKYNLDYELFRTVLVAAPDRRGVIRWENFPAAALDARALDDQPAPGALYAMLEAPFSDAKIMTALQKDFLDWTFRTAQVMVRSNEQLKMYAGPEVNPAGFRQMCAEAARQARDAEITKASDVYDKKLDALRVKLSREERELAGDESELSQRRMEEMGTHAENVFSLFSGRKSSRRLSSSLSKRRMTEQAKDEVEESLESISDFKKQIEVLEKEKQRQLDEINSRWGDTVNQINEITVAALKKDVLLDLFGVAWFPYHLIQVGGETLELPGFGQA